MPGVPSTAGWVPRGDHLCETEGSQSTNPRSAQSFGATGDKSAFLRIQPPHRDRLIEGDVQIFKMVVLSLKAQVKLGRFSPGAQVPGTQPEHMARRDLDFDPHLAKPHLK